MIGHDGPSVQTIALTIERQEGVLDKFGDRFPVQPASTPAAVEHFVAQGFRVVGRSQPVEGSVGKTVGQPEGDELNRIL